MKFNEVLNEYYDMQDDSYSASSRKKTRRPRLTLRHLNRLKRVREMKRVEQGQRARDIPSIYNAPESM